VVAGSHRPPKYETRRDNEVISFESFGDDCRLLSMTREHLHNCLARRATAVGVEIVTSSNVVGARAEGVLLLDNGRQLKADLVVGADGVRSSVRDSLDLPLVRDTHTDGITRLLVPRMKKELGAGDWDNILDLWVTKPGTLRILYSPCNEEYLYLACLAPEDNPRATRIPMEKQVWIDALPQLEPALATITDQGRRDLYETSRVGAWSRGRVAVVGDAAHAMCPPLAQGGGCALMNALSLAVWVDGARSVEEGLTEWERVKRPLTDRTQNRAENFAKTRRMSQGNQWRGDAMETARHRPTGT
jgi:2-methyl-3-hydroxypyridine 5-carboxylic acid dioxygenase